MFPLLANVWSICCYNFTFYFHPRWDLVPTDQKTASTDRGTRRVPRVHCFLLRVASGLALSVHGVTARHDHQQKSGFLVARAQSLISDWTSEKEALYSVLLDRKALHSMIVPVSDIEIALPIEGQTSGTRDLICSFSPSISTHHDSAL